MMGRRGLIITLLSLAVLLSGLPALAQEGDMERGEVIYAKRCIGCHGEEGDGVGAADERLNPPPRDFSLGLYKIKTTAFDDDIPNDSDLLRMIRDGMPGTAMPGWSDVLSEQEMLDLVAYIKTFAGLEEEEATIQIDYGGQITSSEDSISKGRPLFEDRCAECHGKSGKGVAVKKLKDDNGARTWPRNLTKPWTFRASNEPKDIFDRITVGIPGTQMPSFADPVSKKKLSIEERWHVANYVATLAETEKLVRPEDTVIVADKVDGDLPDSPEDPRWAETAPTSFLLLPQLIGGERFFMPTNDTISVRALYDTEAVALLLEWDDRTKSTPGDPKAESLAEPGMGEDMVAVQWPIEIPEGMEKPYFLRGDAARPVNFWQWRSGTADGGENVALLNASGLAETETRDAGAAGLTARGTYDKGTWRVVMRRPLAAADPETDLGFAEGKFIPVAFAAWDGSNGETGSKHSITTWYWLLLRPPTGTMPYAVAVLVALLIGAGQIWWARTASAKARREDA